MIIHCGGCPHLSRPERIEPAKILDKNGNLLSEHPAYRMDCRKYGVVLNNIGGEAERHYCCLSDKGKDP